MTRKIFDFIKKIVRSRTFKVLLVSLIVLICLILIFAVGFVAKCSSVQSNFRPVNDPAREEFLETKKSFDGYFRTEETTYLTFPEWYLVFNPQEYATYLFDNPPSGFPYFSSVSQFWYGYCQVYGITSKNYKFNAGNHLVEVVIGTSFTVEYLIKGIYENTVGRISEFIAWGRQTEEDIYAAKVAKEYGEFIPDYPWYEFPFGSKLKGLWTENSFFGNGLLRKLERKFFLSLEYGVKAIYGKLLGLGTQATFGTAETKIYTHVKVASNQIFQNPRVKKMVEFSDGSQIISVPHYQGFSDTVPLLAKQGLKFIDVAGNDEILVTAIASSSWKYNLRYGSELFTMGMMTNSQLKRIALQAPVKHLSEILNQLSAEGVRIEHLFDY